jgi:hypothetical protein
MHLKNKFPYLILLLFLMSCDKRTQEFNFPTIPIDPDLQNIPFSLSEIAGEIHIIHLETNPESLIGSFSSLAHLDDSHIIIKSNKSILIFDREGRLLNKIHALGKGPMEYNTITNIYVDPVSQQIYIIDYDDIKVYKYDGKYVETLKLPVSVSGMRRNNKGGFIFSFNQIYKEKGRGMLLITDSTLNVQHTFMSKNPDYCKDITQNLFFSVHPYEVNNRLHFKEPFVDTIYQINNTDLVPHWAINMSGLGFTTCEGINIEKRRKASNDKIPPVGIKETDNYFFIDYIFNKAKYTSMYDKRLKNFTFHQKFTREDFPDTDKPNFGFVNNLIAESPLFWPVYVNDEVIVSLVDPVSLGEKALAAFDCKEDDNSLLLIAKLK